MCSNNQRSAKLRRIIAVVVDQKARDVCTILIDAVRHIL